MRLLIADPDCPHRRAASERLGAIPGIRVSDICADLTATFNAVEHRPPTLALIAPELVAQPEFEMMEMLFRSLSVRWMPLVFSRSNAARLGTQLVADLSSDDVSLQQNLRARLASGNAPMPRANTGLLRSVGQPSDDGVILIGSSTGGIDALLQVLGSFPEDCPPTLIVQHTGAAFSSGLARLFDRNVAPQVREARDGEPLRRGSVLLAPGSDQHLVLHTRQGQSCRLVEGPRVSGHRPSVDALFASAVPIAKKVTAAILTGMGRDGADGMLALRQAGARTIGQNRATSVVYGMPGQAAELGAVGSELPIGDIGPAVLRAAQRNTA